MKAGKFIEMSKDAYNRYKLNIAKSQKTPKNMFELGYQAALIEHSKMIEELQHHKDTTVDLYATDKEMKIIADTITKQLSEKFNLMSVDSFDINQHLIKYLNTVMFRL